MRTALPPVRDSPDLDGRQRAVGRIRLGYQLAIVLLLAVAILELAVGVVLPPNGPGLAVRTPATPESTPAVGVPASPSPIASPAPSPAESGSPPRAGVSPLTLAVLDARLEALRVASGIPGISATIIFPDGTRWTGVGGLADVEHGIPVRPGTPFALGSISKTFTAALILQLVASGRLSLDAPAAPHLAGARISIDPRITIRQLLDHTSGLADFLLNPKIERSFAAAPDAAWTVQQSLTYLQKPVAPPGSVFAYSNTNYLLLGLIAEEVTATTLPAALRAAFFEPLGLLTATYQGVEAPFLPIAAAYRFNTDSPAEPPTRIASGTGVVPFRAVVSAAGAAGSIAAASPDVATWARDLFGGQAISLVSVSQMVDDSARATAIDPRRPYGLGVDVLAVDGHLTYGHSGRYLGARSSVRYFPGLGLTVAVLTNQSRTDPATILLELARIVLGEEVMSPPGLGEPAPADLSPIGGV